MGNHSLFVPGLRCSFLIHAKLATDKELIVEKNKMMTGGNMHAMNS